MHTCIARLRILVVNKFVEIQRLSQLLVNYSWFQSFIMYQTHYNTYTTRVKIHTEIPPPPRLSKFRMLLAIIRILFISSYSGIFPEKYLIVRTPFFAVRTNTIFTILNILFQSDEWYLSQNILTSFRVFYLFAFL